MKNKNVGFLVIGISILVFIIIVIFNQGMTNVVDETCSHGPSCTMYDSIRTQTYLSFAIAGIILIVGLFLVFSKEEKEVVIKKIKPFGSMEPKRFDQKSLEGLDNVQKKVMNLLLENNSNMFQSELIKRLNINKVKMTRILDNLESLGFIERKRRGMANIVVIKNS